MRKVVILRAAGNELANQLWNYASIYAYTLERGYALENPSFFEYGMNFAAPKPGPCITAFFFLPFQNYTKRKTAFRRKVWRKFYLWYTKLIAKTHHNDILSYESATNTPYYLPPTDNSHDMLRVIEEHAGNIYLDGWLFRNPKGLKKYHEEIKHYLRPRKDVSERVETQIKKIRMHYNHVVGVHIRQGDYATWRKGTYLIEQERVREIIKEYLEINSLDKEKVFFLITSDGSVDLAHFSGLHVMISDDNATGDLFLLASTDIIIGSNSTFGAFASYYGNIPFIVMQKEKMDWGYYHDKTSFFENKYSTMVHY